LAVYRGKMSEGLSFNDDLCRGVICLGVPYPPATDMLVLAKRRWNDAQCTRAGRASGPDAPLSGDAWYELQAYRAVNQALGRCIRHHADYGVLLLLDARWARGGDRARNLRRHLAHWMQPFVEEWANDGGAQVNGGLCQRLRTHFLMAPLTLGSSGLQASASSTLSLEEPRAPWTRDLQREASLTSVHWPAVDISRMSRTVGENQRETGDLNEAWAKRLRHDANVADTPAERPVLLPFRSG